MESVFIDSLLAEPPFISGIRVKPFSCWHALMLMRLDSPLSAKNIEVKEKDVLTALLICMDSKKDKLARYLRFANSRLYRLYWRIRLGLTNKDKFMDSFYGYISFYCRCPDIWKPKDSKQPGTPFPFSFVCSVSKKLNKDIDEVWDMPLCLIQSYVVAFAEMDGCVEVADNVLREMEAIGI